MKILFFWLYILVFSNDDCKDIALKFSSRFPFSFYIFDITSKKAVKECNSDLLLVPGSTIKILTSVYSLEKLGRDFQFKTEFIIKNRRNDSVNLFLIRPNGNFTLGSENFNSSIDDVASYILNIIKKNNIKEIDTLIIENPYISFPDGSIEWQDVGNYYSTSVSFFSINDNSYKLYFKTKNKGSKAILLKVVPNLKINFTNLVYAGSFDSGDNSYIYSNPYSDEAVIVGTLPENKDEFIVKGALFRPDLFFVNYLCDYLSKEGIDVKVCSSSSSVFDIKEGSVIDVLYSPKLVEIIRVMNKKSFNFYADSLLHFALIESGKIGLKYSLKELSDFLFRNSVENFRVVDGSGLSRRNLFSTKGFVRILNYAYEKDYFEDFYNSLVTKNDPQAKGSIKNFDISGVDDFRVKSGSLNSIRSYCGYVKKGSRVYSFSFIFNNYLDNPSYIEDIVKGYLSNLN